MKLKKIIILSALMLCIGQIFAEIGHFQTINGIRYLLGDTSLTAVVSCLEDNNEYFGDIKIPSTVIYEGKSYGVYWIGASAFANCKLLTSVKIPNSVKSIGKYAFYGCEGLTSINIPNSVKFIGQFAFYGCKSLTSITISNRVKWIRESTFQYCTNLKSAVIGDSVTHIGRSAFESCNALTSIYIGKSVTDIGPYAFKVWGNNIGIHISNIAGWCNISVEEDFPTIGSWVVDNWYWDLYINNVKVKDLIIPEGVKEIKAKTFSYCRSISSVYIPNSVTHIRESAFEKCTNLVSISIPRTTKIEKIFGKDTRMPKLIVR